MNQLILHCFGAVAISAAAIAEEAPQRGADIIKNGSTTNARTLPEYVFVKTAATYRLVDKGIFEHLRKLAQTKPTYPPGTGFSSGEPWAEVLISGEIPNDAGAETAQFSVCVSNALDFSVEERSGSAKITMRTLGYATDTVVWRLLCSKYGTPREDKAAFPPHEKVTDEALPSGSDRAAPRQSPEGPSPSVQ